MVASKASVRPRGRPRGLHRTPSRVYSFRCRGLHRRAIASHAIEPKVRTLTGTAMVLMVTADMIVVWL